MLSMLLRLFALRPILTAAIMGFPVLLLIAVGLVTIYALKALLFIGVPVLLVVLAIWWFRRASRQSAWPSAPIDPPAATDSAS